MCDALASERAVFIVALGRSGSSHLLHLLNAIPGYRVSGETENAWLHLARHARAAPNPAAAAVPGWPSLNASTLPRCETWEPFSERAGARALRLEAECQRVLDNMCEDNIPCREKKRRFNKVCKEARKVNLAAHRCHAEVTPQACRSSASVALDCPVACGTCRPGGASPYADAAQLCAARRLFLAAHNPPPRASVFGFKEIYSPWIRRADVGGGVQLSDALDEVIDGGVDFLRGLWPKAKFIFHARRNLTRVAASDFWRDADACDAACARRFERVVARYRAYAWRNPQHAMFTTIEGLTSPLRSWRETSRSCALRLVQSAGGTSRAGSVDATDCLEADLGRLFRWLGEELTTSLRSTAISHLHLRDWSEETHARRVRVELPNGTVVYETRAYAFATSEQLTPEFQQEKEKERLEKASRLAAAHRAAKKARRAARPPG